MVIPWRLRDLLADHGVKVICGGLAHQGAALALQLADGVVVGDGPGAGVVAAVVELAGLVELGLVVSLDGGGELVTDHAGVTGLALAALAFGVGPVVLLVGVLLDDGTALVVVLNYLIHDFFVLVVDVIEEFSGLLFLEVVAFCPNMSDLFFAFLTKD